MAPVGGGNFVWGRHDAGPNEMQWLLHDGDDCKTIVPHISDDHDSAAPQGCGDMTIPAKAIVRMVDLKGDPNADSEGNQ